MALVHVHVSVKRPHQDPTPIGTFSRADRDEYTEAFDREIGSYLEKGFILLDQHVKITGTFLTQMVIHPMTEEAIAVSRWYCQADSCVVPHEECGASKDMGPRHDLTRVVCDLPVGHKLVARLSKHSGMWDNDNRVSWS